MVEGDIVYCIDPLTVLVIGEVCVSLVVPEWVVLADIVFELETELEKLVVPVDVFDEEALLVSVALTVVDLELRGLKE